MDYLPPSRHGALSVPRMRRVVRAAGGRRGGAERDGRRRVHLVGARCHTRGMVMVIPIFLPSFLNTYKYIDGYP